MERGNDGEKEGGIRARGRQREERPSSVPCPVLFKVLGAASEGALLRTRAALVSLNAKVKGSLFCLTHPPSAGFPPTRRITDSSQAFEPTFRSGATEGCSPRPQIHASPCCRRCASNCLRCHSSIILRCSSSARLFASRMRSQIVGRWPGAPAGRRRAPPASAARPAPGTPAAARPTAATGTSAARHSVP